MKTNFKYVTLMAAAFTLGLSSCSNDDSATDGGLGEGMRGEPTTMSIVAKQSGAIGTYAFNPTPTGDEGVIVTATTYIFDGAGTLEVVQPLTVNSGQATASNVTITTGPKTFFIVANAPANLASQLTGSAITPGDPAALTKTLFEKLLVNGAASVTNMGEVAVPTAGAGTGYFMTAPEGGKQQTLNPGASNSVSMKIGRAFSKANLEFPAASVVYEASLGGTLTNVAYLVRNIKDNTFNQAVYSGPQLESYNYNKWAAGPTPPLAASDFFIEGGTLTATTGFPATSQHFATSTVADGTSALYAMENANSTPLYGTATFTQIGGKWELDATTDVYDASNTVLGQGQTFLNVTGDFYRIVEFDDAPASATKVLREISNKYYETSPVAGTVNTEVTAFDLANPGNTANAANVGILKYEDGKVYYSVYLTNPAAVSASVSETFMVERNKYYYVTVKSINRLGSNTAEITNPGEEITTSVDLSANVEVGDWDDASSNADL